MLMSSFTSMSTRCPGRLGVIRLTSHHHHSDSRDNASGRGQVAGDVLTSALSRLTACGRMGDLECMNNKEVRGRKGAMPLPIIVEGLFVCV